MMKRTWLWRCAVVLVWVGCSGVLSSAQAAAITDAEASTMAMAYGSALKTGDVRMLGSLFGSELLASRQALLEMPEYADELRQTYESATITVIGIRQDGRGAALVKLQVQYAGGLPMYRELTIADPDGSGNHRIISETDAAR